MALLIIVPLVLIIVVVAWNQFSGRSERVIEKIEDPNKDVTVLDERFKALEAEYRSISGLDRESGTFEARVRGLVTKFEKFMDDFELVFGPRRSPDGTLPPQFAGYSELKARAGQCRSDLIRLGGF